MEVVEVVEVAELPRGQHGTLNLDALREVLEAGGARLVAMSVASDVTGEALPWHDVVGLAHAHGALCLLDGAQVAGWVPLDLAELQVDLLAFAGHKGPQGPSGVGGLYVRPGVSLDSPGASCDGAVYRTGPGYCDTDSVNGQALAGLSVGWTAMDQARPLERAMARATALRGWLRAQTRVRIVGGEPLLPTIRRVVDGPHPVALATRLTERGVVARGGTQCAPRAHRALGTGEDGTLRLSFGPWGHDADVKMAWRRSPARYSRTDGPLLSGARRAHRQAGGLWPWCRRNTSVNAGTLLYPGASLTSPFERPERAREVTARSMGSGASQRVGT